MNFLVLLFAIGLGARLHRFVRSQGASHRAPVRGGEASDIERVRRTLRLENLRAPRGTSLGSGRAHDRRLTSGADPADWE